MSVSLRVGQSVGYTAAALQADGVTPDPDATITYREVDAGGQPAASGLISLTDNGGGSATVSATAEGAAFILGEATDPDGKVTDSAVEDITVQAGFAATDAASVTLTPGTPA